MRRLLAASVSGLILLLAAPAALAADYPPKAVKSGVVRRAAPPAPVINVVPGEDSLAGTGLDTSVELGLGAGLILVGGTVLLVVRRRRGTVRS